MKEKWGEGIKKKKKRNRFDRAEGRSVGRLMGGVTKKKVRGGMPKQTKKERVGKDKKRGGRGEKRRNRWKTV